MKNKIAERLTESLKVNNMSQSELARRINLDQRTISSYCKGRIVPSVDVLIDICDALDETADYILGRDEENKNI